MTAEPTAADLFSLHGKVAIVTGGAMGIGSATVRALASAGARTVLADLASADPAGVGRRLTEEGLPVDGVVCDVTDGGELADLVAHVVRTLGGIDIVVCNAGTALDTGPHTTTTDQQLDTMFDLHVRSPLRLANVALPRIAERGGGSFIIISSIAGLRGNRVLGSYGVTKAANAQLARNLAVQWGAANIRVNAVSPGVIRTRFAQPITADPDAAAARLAKTPLGRFGEPHHVAGTVLWLASEAGSFTSGQNIVVDGGTLISD